MTGIPHQFIDRDTGSVKTEPLYWDRTVRLIYSSVRERSPVLFRALTGSRASSLLAFLNYDFHLYPGTKSFLNLCGADFAECAEPPDQLRSARQVFQRKISYWECRPMPSDPNAAVSPADSRVLVGSLSETSGLFIKGKFFDLPELLGIDKPRWMEAFSDGDFAVFRLTPEKYHYNHVPVSGRVVDFYEVKGAYHSCNPSAVVSPAAPYVKNRRVVTVIDTDVPGGTMVGFTAVIEIVALMIGDIVQCYSEREYEDPRPIESGMFLSKGMPKSLFLPGSSTDVLLFQKGRIRFAEDLVSNTYRSDAVSRYSQGFGRPLVETDLKVRSLLALPGR